MKQIVVRLKPDQDLKQEISKIVKKENIQAGCILSLVGSLKKVNLRMAGGQKHQNWQGDFEVVSATGTLSPEGCHIHIAISDKDGQVFGGHLQDGCLISTTVELIILSFNNCKFMRKSDEQTGWKELEIKHEK